MKQSNQIPQYDANHYAVVDLGSNSFHLLIIKLKDEKIVTVNKVKRKVRLASGLNQDSVLSDEAIKRGLDCLSLFADHLSTIPNQNMRIVATATIRIAKNRDDFLTKANAILPLKIQLLSGVQEAETIYKGVAHTGKQDKTTKKLVIDIGGASTELIVGQGFVANKAVSLNVGCVSYKENFFADGALLKENFDAAINSASKNIQIVSHDFIKLGWQAVVGSSGTLRALAEILAFRQQEMAITAAFLDEVKLALIEFKSIDNINFEGLRADRAPVIASGLCILIALFNCLGIKELRLSTGALREGLLYDMLAK